MPVILATWEADIGRSRHKASQGKVSKGLCQNQAGCSGACL
jgi:hypothetical protein